MTCKKGAVQAGKWSGYHGIFLIKLADAAQRRATAVYAACKPEITRIVVHNVKTKFMAGREAILGAFMKRKAKLIEISGPVSYILDIVPCFVSKFRRGGVLASNTLFCISMPVRCWWGNNT